MTYHALGPKIVVVDQQIAFCGGIDLTEGRFDDFLHRVSDIGYDTCDTTVTKGRELADVQEEGSHDEHRFGDKDCEANISVGDGILLGSQSASRATTADAAGGGGGGGGGEVATFGAGSAAPGADATTVKRNSWKPTAQVI